MYGKSSSRSTRRRCTTPTASCRRSTSQCRPTFSGRPANSHRISGSASNMRKRSSPSRPNAHRSPDSRAPDPLRHPPDDGSSADGVWNLGDLVDDLEKMRKFACGCIGADLDGIADARGMPGRRVEATGRGDPDALNIDAQPPGLPVNVIEHTPGCREVQQMPTSEIGLHRDALRSPPVREAGGPAGVRPKCPGTDRNLEAIVHEPFPSAAATRQPKPHVDQ